MYCSQVSDYSRITGGAVTAKGSARCVYQYGCYCEREDCPCDDVHDFGYVIHVSGKARASRFDPAMGRA
jgi:hypothetical protein